MKVTVSILSVLAILAAVFFGGFYYAKRYRPTVVERTRIEYVPRPIARGDTATTARPETRRVFERPVDLVAFREAVADSVWAAASDSIDGCRELMIPAGFRPVGIVSASPVRFDRGDVLVTYYTPALGAFAQDRYSIPRARHEAYFAPLLSVNPFAPTRLSSVGFEAGYRWNALVGYARAEAIADGGIFASLGVRVLLYHSTR